MDSLPEQERKNPSSYFSWLPQDLTLRYLPFWLKEVNSDLWTRPLQIVEERTASSGSDPGYTIFTHDHRRYVRTSENGYSLINEEGIALHPAYLPAKIPVMETGFHFDFLLNESIILHTGELITSDGIKSLWTSRRLVWTNRRNEIYSIRNRALITIVSNPYQLEVFNAAGELILQTPVPSEIHSSGALNLVDQTLYHLYQEKLSAWNPWSGRVWMVNSSKCTIPLKVFPNLISDHRKYWIHLVNVFEPLALAKRDFPWLLEEPTSYRHLIQVYNLEGQMVNQMELHLPPRAVTGTSFHHTVSTFPGLIGIFPHASKHSFPAMFLVYSPDGLLHLYYPDHQRHLIIGPTI